ncbi:MAG: discoidin domain-containing protein [Bacteroidota bacterium]
MKKKPNPRIKRLFIFLLIVASPIAIMAQVITTNANVAFNRPGAASSIQTDKIIKNAFDGNAATRYSSLYSDSEWVSVDLGQPFLVSQVVLIWERAYGKDFDILFSRDGSFTDLNKDSVQIRNNVLGSDSIAGTNSIKMKSNTIARYVRMQGVQRATVFGYSLYEFQVAGSVSSSALLPATLTGFTASGQSSGTLLEWTTTTENNTAGFSVERSNDGTSFSAIGWVDGINNGSVVSHYSYIDKQVLIGRNYYRLKVFDLSGKAGSTPAVAISTADNNSLKIYPIPVKDHLSIEYKGTAGTNMSVFLTSTSGHTVYTNSFTARGSQQTIVINRTSDMVAGIYFITIGSTGKKQYTEQIILE